MKIGLILFAMFIMSLIVLGVLADADNHNRLVKFCKDNGFEYVEQAQWKYEDSMCVKIVDNTRIESVVDKCGNNWCFVKQEKAE